jgi:hypothetical protein
MGMNARSQSLASLHLHSSESPTVLSGCEIDLMGLLLCTSITPWHSFASFRASCLDQGNASSTACVTATTHGSMQQGTSVLLALKKGEIMCFWNRLPVKNCASTECVSEQAHIECVSEQAHIECVSENH